LGFVLLSFAIEQIGWVHHEAGHRSLFGSVTMNKITHYLAVRFILGGSEQCWNFQHNNHHANTQNEDFDKDVQTMPLVAFDSYMLEEKHSKNGKEGNQKKTYIALDSLSMVHLSCN